MASSSQSVAASGSQALAAYRDAQGFLPLLNCDKCGTRLIGRISQKSSSKGKRFYKCPMLEHTSMACPFYMFEEHYVDFFVKEGVLPTCFSTRGMRHAAAASLPLTATPSFNEAIQDARENLGEAVKGVQASINSLANASEDRMKDLCKKVDRLGELGLYVGLANQFVVVLILLVLLVK